MRDRKSRNRESSGSRPEARPYPSAMSTRPTKSRFNGRFVMQRRRTGLWLLLVLLLWISSQLQAQQQAPTTAPQTGVPRLIKFAGSATSAEGKALSGTVGITFAIYQDQQGGAPLWMETQNVTLDRSGHYTALLGATKPDSRPMDLFTSGQARWLGATMNGDEEQP